MTSRNMLKQIGGATILFGALALAPLAANAAMTKKDISPPMFNANTGAETFHSNPSAKGWILVPRVGYVNINDYGAEPHHMAENMSRDVGLVLVPKDGYLDVKAVS